MHVSSQKVKDITISPAFEARLNKCISRLYLELDRLEIKHKPLVYISEDWFSPDESPVIAVPFFLTNPKLVRLAKVNLLEVEGTTEKSFMKLLRHEAGHAFETAYNLKYSRIRQRAFGLFSTPYPSSYSPAYSSSDYVSYLGEGYAQCHPCEDFAETFAHVLEFSDKAEEAYKQQPGALRKIRAMKKIISSVAGKKAKNRSRRKIDSYKKNHNLVSKLILEKSMETKATDKSKVFEEISHIPQSFISKLKSHNNSDELKTYISDFRKYHRSPLQQKVIHKSRTRVLSLKPGFDLTTQLWENFLKYRTQGLARHFI